MAAQDGVDPSASPTARLPQPPHASAPARRRWPLVLALAAVLCAFLGGVVLERLSRPPVPAIPPSDLTERTAPQPGDLVQEFLAQAAAPVPEEIPETYAEGNRLAEELVQSLPNCAEGLCFAGRMYQSFHDSSRAIECWERALRLAPDVPDPHFCLGSAAWEKGDYEKAVGHLRQAVKLDPGLTQGYLYLGGSLLSLGKAEEAAALLENCPVQMRKNPEVLVIRGQAHVELRQYEEAKACFETALAARPRMLYAQYCLMTLLVRTGRSEEAQQHRQAYMKLVAEDKKAKLLADSSEKHLSELRTAMVGFCLSLGQIYAGNGRLDQAARLWARATRFAPDDPRPRELLRTVCTQLATAGTASRRD